jgi:hypothetical protein
MIRTASSSYVRSAPLILIFLSSAAFAVGVILIRNEMGVYASRLGFTSFDEIVCTMKTNLSVGKTNLEQRLENAIDCIDSMVVDDVLRMVVKTGNEIVTGVAGGFLLYSLPDKALPQGSISSSIGDGGETLIQTQNARRRVINAMDPSFDDVLFRPGGLWSVTPGFREYLIGLVRSRNSETPSIECVDAPTVDSTANESESHEDEKFIGSNKSLPTLIHVHKPQAETPPAPEDRASRSGETVFEAVTATVKDALLSSLGNINSSSDKEQEPPTPPPIQFEKILQSIAVTATICFFLHLQKSPSTRKTWKSALNLGASCALLSTAVGTGVASILSSTAENSIIGMICLKGLEGMSYLHNVKIRELFHKFREIIKSNRQLQMALAFTVVYGLKRSQRRVRARRSTR